ncbi:MAG: hypothetical protein OIF38_13570 [Cellvibrionaceae bacterium]|nr:hypothetical protein [Cellvibrionaceae bacterium]
MSSAPDLSIPISLDLAAQHHPHLLRSASYHYPHRQAFKPFTGDAKLLAGQNLSISPLALMINLPGRAIAKSELGRAFFDHLLQEISLYKTDLGRRPVTKMLLRHPFYHYQGADITELMHQLASNFRLSHKDQTPVEYCVELDPREASPENVALLCGLGFNDFLLSFPRTSSRDQLEILREGWRQVEDYNPGNLSIRLPYGYPEQDLHNLRNQLDIILQLKPQRLVLTPASELEHWELQSQHNYHNSAAASQFALAYSAMRNAGYRVLGNDCFVKGKHNLAIAQNQNRLRRTPFGYNSVNAADLLGLGPAAVSQLGRHYFSNHEQLVQYQAKLNRGQAPIAKQLSLEHLGKVCRVIIDQLLCYHRLDISYIEHRYDLKLLHLAENIAWELNSEANMELIRIHNGLLQLKDEGIMRLLFICDTFLTGISHYNPDD